MTKTVKLTWWDATDAWVETDTFQEAKWWFIVGVIVVVVLVMAVQEWSNGGKPPGGMV